MKQYASYFALFLNFLYIQFSADWCDIASSHITLYLSYLFHHKNLAPTTLRSHLSGIAFYVKLLTKQDLTKDVKIQYLLKAFEKTYSSSLIRKPIDHVILHQLLAHVSKTYKSVYYKHAFYILYTLMYRLALRVSEIADYSKSFNHSLQYDNFHFDSHKNLLRLRLSSFKHSKAASPDYVIPCNSSFAFHINEFLNLRGRSNAPVFIHKSGLPFSRTFITNNLRVDLTQIGLNAKHFNTHSFRIGRCTDLASFGYSDQQITLIGRWSSNAFRKYIKPSLIKV